MQTWADNFKGKKIWKRKSVREWQPRSHKPHTYSSLWSIFPPCSNFTRKKNSCWGRGRGRKERCTNRWWRPGSYLALRHLVMKHVCPSWISMHRCIVFSLAFEVSPSTPGPWTTGSCREKCAAPAMLPQWSWQLRCAFGMSYQSSKERRKTQFPSFLRKPDPQTEMALWMFGDALGQRDRSWAQPA